MPLRRWSGILIPCRELFQLRLTIRRETGNDALDCWVVFQELVNGYLRALQFQGHGVGMLQGFLTQCTQQVVHVPIHVSPANLMLQAQVIRHGF